MLRAPIAVFRADAGLRIGGGHVTRCLTLAGALVERGWDCAFASASGSERTVPSLGHAGFPVIATEGGPEREAEVIARVFGRPADLLIIDHPAYAAAEERAFAAAAGMRLVIDGRFRAHDADLWLDPNPGHDLARLRSLANPGCTILTGAEFVPIDPRVALRRDESLRRRAEANHTIGHVLVSFGASEQATAIAHALESLARVDRSLVVTVLAGGAALSSRDLARKLGLRARVMEWSDDMGGMMAAADLMIGAAGTNAWERCCLGLPSLLATVADDQRATAALLDNAGAAVDLGTAASATPERMAAALQILRAAPDRMRALSQNATALIDGLGSGRVAVAIDRKRESAA